MLHLDSVDKDVVFIVFVVIVEESTVKHDWVVLLRNLVRLWQVAVRIVLSVEFDLREDTAAEGEGCLHGLVEAVLVQDWQHAWKTHINEVCACVRSCVGFAECS